MRNAKVMPCQDEFMPKGTENISALSLIKVIVRESDIDTNAMMMHIRQDSSKLDEEFARQACDIIALNTHVKSKLKALHARGEQTLDLLPNLFKACESAEDEDFRKYVADRKTQCEDGSDLTPEQLMVTAANKYKNLVLAKMRNHPAQDQERILALETKLKKHMGQEKKSKQVTSQATPTDSDISSQIEQQEK